MKKLFIILFIVWGFSANAQGAAVKAMLKQIALLQNYIGYVEKGYDIARRGLNTISNIKNAHLALDADFFNSLKNVNPTIKSYFKVAAIAGEQEKIISQCARLKKYSFNKDEAGYIDAVTGHLLNQCEGLVAELTIIITDGQLTMTDDERIKNIDRIYDGVREQSDFIRNFSVEAMALIRGRGKEKNDINVSKKLHGL